ncbi:MAG: ATP-binding protein [Deltaproteobacteria bacterium]
MLWLAGVRRAGKTTLLQSLPNVHSYHDCELVRVRRALEDPELFFRRIAGHGIVVLDEVHRLTNPSEVLKIAADHFPHLRVIATGPSTLAARNKFKDSLTGRKRELWLVPLLSRDLEDFGMGDLDRRMLHGGLPPFFLSTKPKDQDYEEWLSSYWAKDLSELFVVEKKAAFMRFLELLIAQSGGLFEAQAFAAPCEISRPTVQQGLGDTARRGPGATARTLGPGGAGGTVRSGARALLAGQATA